ncbi:MAG TPA: OB-fold nucleic acid binding domain-containing protein, partial [Anaerolineae bacterium]
MNRTLIRDLAQSIGTDLCIQGWVHTIRDQKAIAFIIVRDQTGLVQVTIDKSKSAQDVIRALSTLTRESAVTIKGRLVANPVVKLGGIEIQPTEFRVESAADPNLPLDPQAQVAPNPDVRMDWRFLDLRRAENLLAFRVQTTALTAMREFWKRENFIELQTPKLMGSA